MLDHDKAMKLWNSILGKSTTRASDCRNRLIYKEAYGQRTSEFGFIYCLNIKAVLMLLKISKLFIMILMMRYMGDK